MAIFRIQHNNFENIYDVNKLDTYDLNEWSDTERLKEPGWQSRYEYEASIIIDSLSGKKIKTVLEIGSGPGVLSQLVQSKLEYPVEYHLVDKPFAKRYFDENNLKGKFFAKDIAIDMDMDGLLPSYDLVVCNDCLEHLVAPSNIVKRISSVMAKDALFFISVPNWRMGHQLLYRGMFDYDNFIYFMYIHGFKIENVYPSILQTPSYPRLSSEESMPEELRQSWNWYFVAKKK